MSEVSKRFTCVDHDDPMTVGQIALVQRTPLLFHMSADGAWPGIERHGLLSASALLDLYGVTGEARDMLKSRRRCASAILRREGMPPATLRDQIPLSDGGLMRCLAPGTTPNDWYRLLNGMVFFWPSRKRLETLLWARSYRDAAHTVLTVDTASLVAAHGDRVRISPINSGFSARNPAPRGPDLFLPLTNPKALTRITEVVVIGGIPDISRHVVDVSRVAAGDVIGATLRPGDQSARRT